MASQAGLRDSFLKKHPYIRFGLGEWRQYKDGVWSPINELIVKSHIQTVTQSNGTKLSSNLVNAVAELVKQKSYLPDQIFDANSSVITFSNCCFDLTSYVQIPHSPDYYTTLKLEFDFDPDAKSDAWDRVIRSFPHADVLQRFSGLAMTTETKYEVALWLHGPPGGGKSTFIIGLEAMLGPRSMVLGLDDLTSRFGLSQLPGKTLAVSTEQPSHFIKSTHKLNTLISGESITIERKYGHSFTTTPRVKMLWAMNDLPHIPSGPGAGLFRRVYPIYWPGIGESERDPILKEAIQSSPMAVANWAIEGLKRVRAIGRFEIPQELVDARNTYREESDLTLCFITDCCDQIEDSEVMSSELYEEYDKWCVKNGHHALASNRFAADLQRLGYSKTRKSIGFFWSNLELKTTFPDHIDFGDAK